MSKIRLLKFNWVNISAVVFLLVLLASYTQIFATAWPYEPGTTLDPECGPEITDCTVNIGGGESQWLTGDNGIYYSGGNVGVGTSDPASSLTVKNNYSTTGEELVTNGTFTGNANGWDIGDGIWADNKITETYTDATSGLYSDAYTDIETVEGKTYVASFTLSNVVNDSVVIQLWNNNIFGDVLYSSGHHAFTFIAEYTGTDTLYFSFYNYNDNSSYTLDDVSVKEVSSLSPAFEVLDIGGNSILKLGGVRNYLGNLFLGVGAGYNVDEAYLLGSNFIGSNAGYEATDANESNFFGLNAGYKADDASGSNFLGSHSGYLASDAFYSNFLGFRAGYEATIARNSNFFGTEAGRDAVNASGSNFIGYETGYLAENAGNSNFIGYNSGRSATNASNSVFLGSYSGHQAINSSNSIYIGNQAGYGDWVNNTLSQNDWSILLGYKTRTGGNKNSVLIGGSTTAGYISNTKANQFMLAPTLTEMRLRGVDYTLPSAQGAASTVLTNNGSGVLSWAPSAGGGGGISLTDLSASTPLNYNNTNGQFSIPASSTTANGYLTSTDWNTFNSKQPTLVSGTNIKTINSGSLLGSGDVLLQTPLLADTDYLTPTGANNIFYTKDQLSLASESSVNWFNISNAPLIGSSSDTVLIDGGEMSYVAGYTFLISKANYKILGELYSSLETQITLLPGDSTDPRIDVIAVNTNGDVVKITGTPSPVPDKPYVNPDTELELTFINVPAGSTSPVITSLDIYKENTGTPGEWSAASNSGTININSSASPRNGSKNIEGTSVIANAKVTFTSASPYNINSATQLVLYIKSKAEWGKNRKLSVSFNNTSGQIGNTVSVDGKGTYGFDSSITSSYQQIAIPITSFGIPASTNITSLSITSLGNQGAQGFHIDDIFIETGTPVIVPSSPTVATLDSLMIDFTGNGLVSNPLTANIIDSSVSLSKIENITSGKLLGRSTALDGVIEEITLGTGLTLSEGILSAGGGSSPITIVNSTNLFSTGLSGTGSGVTDINHSIFLGTEAGYGATGSGNSYYIGRYAGKNATNSYGSNFMGVMAGIGATDASNSNFFGMYAGEYAINAYDSNFIGTGAGGNTNNAYQSNFIGADAGDGALSSYDSNFIGTGAGGAAETASNSIFIGTNAGLYDTVNNTLSDDDWSILIGNFTNTGGFKNSILMGGGGSTLGANISNTKANQFMLAPTITEMRLRGVDYTLPSTQGAASTVLTNNGSGVLSWAPGGGGGLLSDADFNTKGGTSAGLNLVTGAVRNTFLGFEAGKSSVTASTSDADDNIAIGHRSLSGNETGYFNVALGTSALQYNTSGYSNIALGSYSLWGNTTGYSNTAVGQDTLTTNSTGYNNTAMGYYSMLYNTIGFNNTAVGYYSLYNNTTGNYNAAFGMDSGRYAGAGTVVNATSNYSLYLGYASRAGASGNSNEIVIGYNTIGSGSNTATIGNSSLVRTYLTGVNLKVGTATAGTAPLKFTAGTNLSMPEPGAVEWNGTNLFITQTGPSRKTIAYTTDIVNSPITVVNSSNLFSTGLTQTGNGVTATTNSNFMGPYAGYQATGASNSNFFGSNAGRSATSASNSNFMGNNAGYNATSASGSNFIGVSSGNTASSAQFSNFLGSYAGDGATNASSSNFIGRNTGQGATSAANSNFIGYNAGGYAPQASNSIFIGQGAGYNDTVNNTGNNLTSILIGSYTNTGGFSNSILLGSGTSGSSISNTKANQFMLAPSLTEMRLRGIDYTLPFSQGGASTVLTNDGSGGLTWSSVPSSAVTTSNSSTIAFSGNGLIANPLIANIIDSSVSLNKIENISSGVLLGRSTTEDGIIEEITLGTGLSLSWGILSTTGGTPPITIVNSSNLFSTGLTGTGSGVTTTTNSNFLGYYAGGSATSASGSNFMGSMAGYFATNASDSNFFGNSAGSEATNSSNSNFMGRYSGYQATSASDSNFFGSNAGRTASSASSSNFIGSYAGYGATNASTSNFIGVSAGDSATSASFSNFLGYYAGYSAINAVSSNFIGRNAGEGATSAANSDFIGYNAGGYAPQASNSIFIGQGAGYNDTVNNTGNLNDFSILIGKSTSTGGFENSIALGGSAINTASNQFMIGSATRPIDTTRWNGSASTQCTLTTGTGIACTSDENLKTDITDLSADVLNKLTQVRTVNFKWLEGDSSINNIGFLAQDLEKYFPELVATDKEGYKSVYYANMTPILTEAIRELNLKVEELSFANLATQPSLISDFLNNVLVSVSDGIAYMKDIVVDSLKVGSPEKRTGITLYDELTGEPYCISISGGQPKTVEGECGIIYEEEEVFDTETDLEAEEVNNDDTEETPELIIKEIIDEEEKENLGDELVEGTDEEEMVEQTGEEEIITEEENEAEADESVQVESNEENSNETETESPEAQTP